MAKQYESLSEKHISFIAEQKMFFVGTATADSRVNVSPKGMNSFKVLGGNRIAWLNVTGSGNETAAHVQLLPRMTIMFCSFEGAPQILRLYGKAKAIHKSDAAWEELYAHFEQLPGTRQIFDMHVEMVQTSCGMAVPLYSYESDREQLLNWATKQGEIGIAKYWHDKNQLSIDGIQTGIVAKNG
ncbi:MAG: pyridoxamine 5'-phosphate oxidase family protein [Rubrivivax sp.]|nr:MAG: pyridoxamine 5'-phosphate oxidase family protein [Rubrivivax sp.]